MVTLSLQFVWIIGQKQNWCFCDPSQILRGPGATQEPPVVTLHGSFCMDLYIDRTHCSPQHRVQFSILSLP